jgi:hypothetical protein
VLREFLEKYFAQENYYVLWLLKSNGVAFNKRYSSIDDCITAIQHYDEADDITVYIAVGKFDDNLGVNEKTGRDKVFRLAHQARSFKTLAVDLDVDPSDPKKFPSQKAAVRALYDMCDKTGLPRPSLMNSGTGVHAWWAMDKVVAAQRWVNMSVALMTMFVRHGVKFDASKIKDATMVLRPPETHHKKTSQWKSVRWAKEEPTRSTVELMGVLKDYIPKDAPQPAASKLNKAQSLANQSSILGAIMQQEERTGIITDIAEECEQIRAILASNGATDASGSQVSEPLWRATLGIAKFCIDDEGTAKALSYGHPDYDEADTVEKMHAYKGTGPTLCASFDKHVPNVCENCQYKVRGLSTPLQLTGGTREIVYQNDEGEEEVILRPPGYEWKNNSIMYTDPVSGEDVFVTTYDMWLVSRVTDIEEQSNHAVVACRFPTEGVKYFNLDAPIIAAGGNDLKKELAAKQVYVSGKPDNLQRYLVSFLKQLQANKEADKSYEHFGWQKDGTFLVGDRVYGGPQPAKMHLKPAARKLGEHLTQAGTFDNWKKATAIFSHPDAKKQGYILNQLIGGSVLMPFTKLDGFLVVLLSDESGSLKSTAGKLGVGAWGNHHELIGKVDDTHAAFYKSFGLGANIATNYIDEITLEKDPDRFGSLVMTLQSGRERKRLSSRADDFRDMAKWSMPIVATSNKDIYDLLGTRMNNEAEQMRIMQIRCGRVPFIDDNVERGIKLSSLVDENYGWAGPMFIDTLLGMGDPLETYGKLRDEALVWLQDINKIILKGKERFQFSNLFTSYASGIISKKANIFAFDPIESCEAVLEDFNQERAYRESAEMDGVDTIMLFLSQHADQTLIWTESPKAKYPNHPLPRTAVARIEMQRDSRDVAIRGTIYISKQALKGWCIRNGISSRDLANKLRRAGAAVDEHARKSLFKGVSSMGSTGQVHCLAIDMMSERRLIAATDLGEEGPVAGTNRLVSVDID